MEDGGCWRLLVRLGREMEKGDEAGGGERRWEVSEVGDGDV